MSKGREPRWVTKATVLAIQRAQLAAHGGAPGVRDEGLLDSALARPMNLHVYEPEAPILRLAAAYAEALCGNHAFVDGNKRVALVVMVVFLELNGLSFLAAEAPTALLFEALAAGEIDTPSLIAWLETETRPVDDPHAPLRLLR